MDPHVSRLVRPVTVTVTAVQNIREHHNRVNKGFVEAVVPNYCDPTFASISG